VQNGHLFARGILELLFYFVFDKFSEILFAQVERFREKRLVIAQIIQFEQGLRVELVQTRNVLDEFDYIKLVRVLKTRSAD